MWAFCEPASTLVGLLVIVAMYVPHKKHGLLPPDDRSYPMKVT
jgi:hypothetical protein